MPQEQIDLIIESGGDLNTMFDLNEELTATMITTARARAEVRAANGQPVFSTNPLLPEDAGQTILPNPISLAARLMTRGEPSTRIFLQGDLASRHSGFESFAGEDGSESTVRFTGFSINGIPFSVPTSYEVDGVERIKFGDTVTGRHNAINVMAQERGIPSGESRLDIFPDPVYGSHTLGLRDLLQQSPERLATIKQTEVKSAAVRLGEQLVRSGAVGKDSEGKVQFRPMARLGDGVDGGRYADDFISPAFLIEASLDGLRLQLPAIEYALGVQAGIFPDTDSPEFRFITTKTGEFPERVERIREAGIEEQAFDFLAAGAVPRQLEERFLQGRGGTLGLDAYSNLPNMLSPAIFEKRQYARLVGPNFPIEEAGSSGIGPETMRFNMQEDQTALGRNIMSAVDIGINAVQRILPGSQPNLRDGRRTVLISPDAQNQNITLETYIPLLDMTVADVLQLTYGEEYLP
jgi:hypothetical protein